MKNFIVDKEINTTADDELFNASFCTSLDNVLLGVFGNNLSITFTYAANYLDDGSFAG